jgi:hypothetical protein
MGVHEAGYRSRHEGRGAAAVQPVSDLAQRDTVSPHKLDEVSGSAARLFALAAFAALPLGRPPSWLEGLAGVPSLTPRGLAAANTAFALRDHLAFMLRDGRQDVDGEAGGLEKFAATKSTPLSVSLEMNATLRARRSSLATIRVAPYRRHRPSARF